MNWIKSTSRWFHYTNTLWCTVSNTLRLYSVGMTRCVMKGFGRKWSWLTLALAWRMWGNTRRASIRITLVPHENRIGRLPWTNVIFYRCTILIGCIRSDWYVCRCVCENTNKSTYCVIQFKPSQYKVLQFVLGNILTRFEVELCGRILKRRLNTFVNLFD
jgi:hypothetical protein